MSLDNLYRRVILDHYRSPRNKGRVKGENVIGEGKNPSCGDDLVLSIRLEGDDLVAVGWEGEGCAICCASASMLTKAIEGKRVDEALAWAESVKALVRGEEPKEDLGEVEALAGVAKFAVRVKCATLPWVALGIALDGEGEATTE
ncbi:SUF system NifU family Fe-S cluster assembly protein [bacterium]|nr:SUF system NifU family Fe-S cluster assembly protein [bacterium]